MNRRRPSRRAVLASGGAGALLAALPACGDDRAPRFGWLAPYMSIQTWTFRAFPLATALDHALPLALAAVELGTNHLPTTATDAELDAAIAALAIRGLAARTWGLAVPAADDAANQRSFEIARRLAARTILIDPPPEAFASLERLVAAFDVRVGIHNHGPGSQYPTTQAVLAAVAGRDPRIGAILDTGHCLRSGEDPVAAIRALAGRLHGLHLKDVAAPDPAAPDVVLGDGALDLAGVLAAVREVGLPPGATVSLEYEANPDDPFADVARALDRVDELAPRA